MTVLVIAIPVLLVLAAVMIIATGRKRAASDAEGRVTGTLSVETRQTDQSVGHATEPGDATGEARERAGETRRAIGSGGAASAIRESTAGMERAPVDEEELGISRRQFFNRGMLITMALSLGAFGAAAISFLYASSAGGFGGRIDAGDLTGRHPGVLVEQEGARSTCPRRGPTCSHTRRRTSRRPPRSRSTRR